MLRPERMSRVSVTGSKRVIDDVIETVHGLEQLHVTEYDGTWEGFEPGDPIEGADEAAEKLVTVRSLQSILDVEAEDAGQQQLVDDETLESELETVRQDVNELDDRREAVRDELRSVEDRIETMEPFVELGIDLDLLDGYDTLSVLVGEGDPESVRDALAASDIDDYDTFVEDDVVAVFARADESDLQDVLVGTPFTEFEVPDGDGDPESYLADLQDRCRELESNLDTVEERLTDKRHEVASFLLAAEEQLAIDVQKREAPLTFATTENAFLAEGWIPTERYDGFVDALATEVGEAVDVEEIERAAYSEHGHHGDTQEFADAGEGGGGIGSEVTTTAAETSPEAGEEQEAEPQEAATDGGIVTMGDNTPPTIQKNSKTVRPFEALVEVINRPLYSELDPTIVLFLTFPAFFGFMIGDLGYGILYMGLGYWLIKSFESDVIKSLGGIGLWAGAFTALFGVLYGEIFGLHALGEIVWGTSESGGIVGQLFGMHGPPIHKGLQPHYLKFAQAWLLLSVIVGIAQLVLGWIFDFVETLEHGLFEAVTESGAWILSTVGMWVWIFSTMGSSAKPPFMFEVFGSGESAAIPLGFTGFSPEVGMVGLGMLAIGTLMLVYSEGPAIALIETITQSFGHVVSYTRIAAVLLAKAGMALAVNLLVFGAYSTESGEFHFIFFEGQPHSEGATVIFNGLFNMDGGVGLVVGILAGIVVLALGHLLVLVLGITSAGLQAVRLEYVEFFGKFYEGGGKAYSPFGYERQFTTED